MTMERNISIPRELIVACYQVIGQLPANQVAKIIIHLEQHLEKDDREFQMNEISKNARNSGDLDRRPDQFEPITPEG